MNASDWLALLGRHLQVAAFFTDASHRILWSHAHAVPWIPDGPVALPAGGAPALPWWPRPEPWSEMARRALAGETSHEVDLTIDTPAGPCAVWVSVKPVREGGDAKVLTVMRTASDVSERTADVRRTAARLRAIFVASPDAITITRVADGAFADVNPAFEKLTGWRRDEVIGRNGMDLGMIVDRDNRQRLAEAVRRDGEVRDWPWPVRHRDGTLRDCVATVYPVVDDGERTMIAQVRDVTEQRRAARLLAENQRRLTALFELSPDPISVTTLADSTFVDVNPAYERLTGWSRAELKGRRSIDVGILVDDAQRNRLAEAIRRDGFVSNYPWTLRSRAGELFECDATVFALEGTDPPAMSAQFRDVSEQRRAQRALAASEERLATMFAQSPDAITISRIDDGTFVDVNPAFTRLVGWSREELIGRRASDMGVVVDHDNRARLVEAVRREGGVREWPWPVRTRQGDVRDCDATVFIVDHGTNPTMTALIRDVSEQRQARRALVESERKFVAMFEASPLPASYSWSSTGGRIEDVNDAWIDAFGYSRDEAVGRRGVELGTWSAQARDALLRRLTNDSRVSGYETWFTRKDGTRFLGSASASLTPLGSDELLLVSIVDVTELHELTHALEERVAARTRELETTLEQLRRTQGELVQSEKLAALGSLVAGISHELNTPIGNSLTVATSFDAQTIKLQELQDANALTRSALSAYLAAAHEAADILSRNLQRASELITSFKQVAADQTSDQRRRFVLDRLLAELVVTLSPTLRKTPFRIVLDVAPDIEMNSLPGPLGQVVTNLVNNALAHAFDGRTAGTLRIVGRAVDADRVELVVEDDGCGISEQHMHRIFEPFFTTRLGRGGTGLGLHIVHNMITGPLGGRIEVHSTVDVGTRFVMTLPRAAPQASATRALASSGPR
ncbi:MAG: PAS domain-containing sensor histidine kinase [Burkholderiales bacterium]|nr:PAS domain-containing sensor histidine kinase [Burkholderiales bacterium]